MPKLRTKAAAAFALTTAIATGALVYDGTHIAPRAVAAPAPVLGGLEVPGIDAKMRKDRPAIRMRIIGTDDGKVDALAGQFLSDVLDFWDQTPIPQGGGHLLPPHVVTSYNAKTGEGKSVCVDKDSINASACMKRNGQTSIEWDRGILFPAIANASTPFSIGMVIAHETGHLVDFQLRDPNTSVRSVQQTLINEQKADCYAGAWLAHVAQGNSRRFTIDAATVGDTLESVLTFRDAESNKGHGIGIERVNASLRGYVSGPDVCAQVDRSVTYDNREGIVMEGSSDDPKRWQPLTESDLQDIRRAVGEVTGTDPSLSTAPCPEALDSDAPAAWCDSRKEVSADFDAFAENVRSAEDDPLSIMAGPGHKISPLLAALAQPRLTSGGVASTSGTTACAVGVLARSLASKEHGALLDFGDLDEILSEMFREGRGAVASDGSKEEWSLNRAKNFLDGVYRIGSVEGCAGR